MSNMGVKHFFFQRISNLLIIVFGLTLLFNIFINGGINAALFEQWISQAWVQTYLLVTLLFATLNSILAGWQISGDYAHKYGLNHTLLVTLAVVISLSYLAVGFYLMDFYY